MPTFNAAGVTIDVQINHIIAEKLNPKPPKETVQFDVKAKLEEKERKTNQVTIVFTIVIGTKPSLVKYAAKGTAIIQGRNEQIEKMLEIKEEEKIPPILHVVYQHVFTAIYLISTITGTPHPPPDLLYSEGEKLGLPPEEEKALGFTEPAKQTEETEETVPQQEETSTEETVIPTEAETET